MGCPSIMKKIIIGYDAFVILNILAYNINSWCAKFIPGVFSMI